MHNPEFYERQGCAASTYNIRGFCHSFDETLYGGLILPRGMLGTSHRSPNRRPAGFKEAGRAGQWETPHELTCNATLLRHSERAVRGN